MRGTVVHVVLGNFIGVSVGRVQVIQQEMQVLQKRRDELEAELKAVSGHNGSVIRAASLPVTCSVTLYM